MKNLIMPNDSGLCVVGPYPIGMPNEIRNELLTSKRYTVISKVRNCFCMAQFTTKEIAEKYMERCSDFVTWLAFPAI